jgi:mycoredoxin
LRAAGSSIPCPWKGQARYRHVSVDSTVNRDAPRYYPQPSPAARKIAGHAAFWHGVRVERVPGPDGKQRTARAAPCPAGSGPGCTGQGRGGELGSESAWRRARVLVARMLVLRDAATGLRSARVPATWVNIWEDRAAAAQVRAITGGDETIPTVAVGAQAMVNPSARQVVAAVRDAQPGTLPRAGGRATSWLARLAGFVGRRRARLWAHR